MSAYAVALDCIIVGCRSGDAGGPGCDCAPDQISVNLLDGVRDADS
jgi:hypothetical protein